MSPSSLRRGRRPEALLDVSPIRAVLELAVPTTAVMSVAAISNVLHTYFVSALGAEAIAAVSLVFPVTLILTTFMGGGIGSGISSAVARALGGRRERDAVAVAEHAFVLGCGLGVVISITLVAGARSVFAAMGGEGQVLEAAVRFARVLYGGLLITFFVATCDSILRGAGNVRVPAVAAAVSLVLQIALTPLFMFRLGMGIAGAAVATIVGQALGSLLRLRYLFGGRALLRVRLVPRRLRPAALVEILRVGVPASLGTLVVYAGLIALTMVFARLGTNHLAAFGLGSRFDFVLLTLTYGTGVAVLTLVGFAAGAGRRDLVFGFASRAFVLVAGGIAVPAVLLWMAPWIWLRLFTDEPEILAIGASYFRIVGITYPFVAGSMILSFSFQGLGRAFTPLIVIAGRVAVVTAVAVFLTASLGYGARPVFLVMAAGNGLALVVLGALFLRTIRRLERNVMVPKDAPHDRAAGRET